MQLSQNRILKVLGFFDIFWLPNFCLKRILKDWANMYTYNKLKDIEGFGHFRFITTLIRRILKDLGSMFTQGSSLLGLTNVLHP